MLSAPSAKHGSCSFASISFSAFFFALPSATSFCSTTARTSATGCGPVLRHFLMSFLAEGGSSGIASQIFGGSREALAFSRRRRGGTERRTTRCTTVYVPNLSA